MNLPPIRKILGNRIVMRRLPATANRLLKKPGDLVTPDGPDDREPHFEAEVLGVGDKIAEDIQPGDRIIVGAHRSQSRVGTRRVLWQGEPAELLSTRDAVAVFRVQARTSDEHADVNMSRDAIEPFAGASGWTAPIAEQREMSERVARRDGFDWRCGHCVESAQECLNGDRGCPYRQPKREPRR